MKPEEFKNASNRFFKEGDYIYFNTKLNYPKIAKYIIYVAQILNWKIFNQCQKQL